MKSTILRNYGFENSLLATSRGPDPLDPPMVNSSKSMLGVDFQTPQQQTRRSFVFGAIHLYQNVCLG
jgi:hypothetical protein